MRLTALAVSLAGCNMGARQPVDQVTVTAATLSQVKSAVAESTLPADDKAAFAAFAATYEKQPEMLAGKSVRTIINQQRSYEVGVALAAEDRAKTAELRAKMARYIETSVTAYSEDAHMLTLNMRVRNKSSKAIKSFEADLIIHDDAGRRVGIAELHVTHSIPPGVIARWPMPMTYYRFGEDAPSMRQAAGRHKTIAVYCKEIIFADGSDAGDDD
jgi:hypothetical protein